MTRTLALLLLLGCHHEPPALDLSCETAGDCEDWGDFAPVCHVDTGGVGTCSECDDDEDCTQRQGVPSTCLFNADGFGACTTGSRT